MSILSTLSSLGLISKAREDKRLAAEELAMKKADSESVLAFRNEQISASKASTELQKQSDIRQAEQHAENIANAKYLMQNNIRAQYLQGIDAINQEVAIGAKTAEAALLEKKTLHAAVAARLPIGTPMPTISANLSSAQIDELVNAEVMNPQFWRSMTKLTGVQPKPIDPTMPSVQQASKNQAVAQPVATQPLSAEEAFNALLEHKGLTPQQMNYAMNQFQNKSAIKAANDLKQIQIDVDTRSSKFMDEFAGLSQADLRVEASRATKEIMQQFALLHPNQTTQIDDMTKNIYTRLVNVTKGRWSDVEAAQWKHKWEVDSAALLFKNQKEFEDIQFGHSIKLEGVRQAGENARQKRALAASRGTGASGDVTIPQYAAIENRILLTTQNDNIAKYIDDTGTSPNSKIAKQTAIGTVSGLIAKNELRTIITYGKSTPDTEPIFQSIASNVAATSKVLSQIYVDSISDDKKMKAATAAVGDIYRAMQTQIVDPNVIKRVLRTSLSQIPMPYADIDSLIDQSAPKKQRPVIQLPTRSNATGKKQSIPVNPIRPSFGTPGN